MITATQPTVDYVSVSMSDNLDGTDLKSTCAKNINGLNNNGGVSIYSHACKAAKYALTAGIGGLAVASVTYVAIHYWGVAFEPVHNASINGKVNVGIEIINQLNQGKTPDQIPFSFYKG